ncbi:hypothetical protein [Cupriavidus basilensis]|uniref:hypothetical protein n=1 Tax=Cupriavidus basilensis TaxID=68895 RepID=UPI00157A4447|nr:hypothetical protein [Cupriavidus basilensis]NUA25990.1 hypothetical protein [Cupriavidus basilensis]
MTSASHFQSAARSASDKFAEHARALHSQCHSFAACVRREYPRIEQLISDGAALESIVHALSESYGVQGSLAALKSALSRIRRSRDGQACQQWLDCNAPVPSAAGGMPDESAAAAPMMSMHTQSRFGFQPRAPFAEATRQHFPGAGQTTWAMGQFQQFQPSIQHSGWQAPFPQHGQFPPPAQTAGWSAQFPQRGQWPQSQPQPISVAADGTFGNY